MDEYLNSFALEGKVALITGGGHGIGFGIACAYDLVGATVLFCEVTQEKVDEGIKAYRDAGVEAEGYLCDVTDENAVKDLIRRIELKYGPVDILVNNASIIQRTMLADMAVEDFRKVVDVDLIGAFICTKAVIPGMIEKGHGKIINICSMMSELARETTSAYAAAKGGLKMLTLSTCAEYAKMNIQCNGIGPGYIRSPQTEPLVNDEMFKEFIVKKTPAERWGRMDDIMGPAIFLASEASNFVNGQILYVDGGMLSTIGSSDALV